MTTITVSTSSSKSVVNGIIGGLAGGVVFGIMMAMMGMLPMVSMLVRQDNAVIGFIVHMGISAFIGAVYGFVIARFPNQLSTAFLGGALNGIVWWVLGALIMMPLMLGMNDMVFVIGQAQWMSLLGHLIYGVIAGLIYYRLSPKS
ncbi:hypothetical protein BECAL_00875 [Bellilinea caldifistulae]|uniref:DUF1440 domain-containing protein n=1 Tax=Bellilinea caldifistulae TaxID=360411 RepID=A0A0P6XQU3_9CHLR|nr:hypothetical protein [Bellilinea caldifistulae]KPL77623.1 hypothetical protein AC812_02850 [Bellilinea caldifistulae]GAP09724.1 hypothetical protein BECAL_00875 [Bellilinea caldifistulae]